MTLVFGGTLVKLPVQYAKAELRRIAAGDL